MISRYNLKDSKNFIASVQYKQWADIVIAECPSEMCYDRTDTDAKNDMDKGSNIKSKWQPFIFHISSLGGWCETNHYTH